MLRTVLTLIIRLFSNLVQNLIRLLLVWLEEGFLVVVLLDRQINSLGKRALIGNFVLGNSVAYNFTKMKSSENHLLGFIFFFRSSRRTNNLKNTRRPLPCPQTKLLHALDPISTSAAIIIEKLWLHHKIGVYLNEIPPPPHTHSLGGWNKDYFIIIT